MKLINIRTSYIANFPMLLSMSIAAFCVWYFHAISESAALFLGIIAGGLVDLDNRLTGRLRNIFFTLVHFSGASLAVQWSYGHSWLFSLLMMTAAFLVTWVGAIDVRYRTIAFGSLLVMLYTVLTYNPETVWYMNPLMLICGTLLYSMLTIAVHLLFPHRPVQDSVAMSYRKLADYMRVKAGFFDPDEIEFLKEKEIALAMSNREVIQSFNQSRGGLFYRLRSQYRHPKTARMLQYYFAAQNIHERISSRHVEYYEFAHQLEHTDLIYRIQHLIVLQANACQVMAEALLEDKEFVYDERLSRSGKGLQQAFTLYEQLHPQETAVLHVKQLITNILAISEQLQRLSRVRETLSVDDKEQMQIASQDIEGWHDILSTLRSHLTFESSVFRHAVRLSILTAISCFIVEFFQLKMGYWILLTGVLVCQPNYSATTTRLKQRILGTILGVLVGSTVPYFAPSLEGQLLIVVVSATLFFVFRTSRYSFSTFFITLQVLAGFAILGMDTSATLLMRISDTVIGAGLAWCAVSYLWPDWHYLTLNKTASRALSGNAEYLQQVIWQLLHGHADHVDYRKARRVAHERSVALSNTVSDMSIEAKKYEKKLPLAMTLLQLNYALISAISALGSIRLQITETKGEGHDDFMNSMREVAERLVLLMRTPISIDTQEQLTTIQHQLETLEPIGIEMSRYVLWSQLQRIVVRLLEYNHVLQQNNVHYGEVYV